MKIQKAIIIAAGMGRRLSPYTDDRPKCLVELRGQPLLHRQIQAYRQIGVREIIIIRGYRGDDLQRALPRLTEAAGGIPVRLIDNPDYARNNILLSLMCAAAELPGGAYCSYGDIIFRPEVAEALSQAPAEQALALAIDPFFRDIYEGRSDHPLSEAEVAQVADGKVQVVGKGVVPPPAAHGEFIGLLRATDEGARWLLAAYEAALHNQDPVRGERTSPLPVRGERSAAGAESNHAAQGGSGLDLPYGRAPKLRVAYLSDLLNDVIARGQPVHAMMITKQRAWREIDTVQDLHRAEDLIDW